MHLDYETTNGGRIKGWFRGVPVDEKAIQQLKNTASLDIVAGWVAAMPDAHVGKGATIGSVVPTLGAVIPAAVGVDLGCGMMAVRTSLTASDLPENLRPLRNAIERAVPHGRTSGGRRGDRGAWHHIPELVSTKWGALDARFKVITDKVPAIAKSNHINHLGTLGTGNHFVEVCLDKEDRVWFMLHSGSRGVGNRIGSIYIERARKEMETHIANLPDRDLAYFREGTESFDDYIEAVGWAQDFARANREVMMANTLRVAAAMIKPFTVDEHAVNCHHNYVAREHHFGQDIWVTRKGAVRAGKGELGIIPGSMGTRSYIVRGLGNPDSFCSCSHGAGRVMSRTKARRQFTKEDHAKATAHVECRKDGGVIDETPAAYKPIEKVMAAQSDLVEIAYELRQVVCVKG